MLVQQTPSPPRSLTNSALNGRRSPRTPEFCGDGREEIERRNAERLKHLRASGELLRQAEDLRALIARVRDAVVAGSVGVDQTRLAEWEGWASAEADRLDPIRSGQIMTHLAPPEEQAG